MKYWMLGTMSSAFNKWMGLIHEARIRRRLAFGMKDLNAKLESAEMLHYRDYRELTDELVEKGGYADALEVALAKVVADLSHATAIAAMQVDSTGILQAEEVTAGEAREQAREQRSTQVLRRWKHRHVAKAFVAWVEETAARARLVNLVRRVVAQWRHAALYRAVGTWLDVLKERRRLKNLSVWTMCTGMRTDMRICMCIDMFIGFA